jgi:hypothetical protein
MKGFTMRRSALLAIIAAVLMTAPLQAQNQPVLKPFDFGISVGMLMPGEIGIARVGDVVTSSSPLFKAHFDAYLIEKLAMGLFASYLAITMDHFKGSSVTIPDADNSVNGYEIGFTIKPCFKLNENLTMKPGVECGYRNVSPEALDDYAGGAVDGFALGANVAFKFRTGGVSPFLMPGFISQPAGGNDYSDVTWPPIFYVAGGIEF